MKKKIREGREKGNCKREGGGCVGRNEKENEREKQQVRMGLGPWIERG